MANRLHSVFRRMAPILGAGMLLQASGCQINGQSLAAGLTNTILSNLVTTWVFRAFNLGAGF